MRIATILLLSVLSARAVAAEDKAKPGEFITEPATLISLGFEWRIEADDNHNARVEVSYRKQGEQAWKAGAPLLRIGNERINENALQYVTPNGFAGSVFDVEPATAYEARFALSDPDSVEGRAERVVPVRTRAEPVAAAGGKVYHVYPPNSKGERQEPAFTGLLAAYYTGASHSDNFNTYPPRVQPATRSWFTLVSTKTTACDTAASAPYRAGHTF